MATLKTSHRSPTTSGRSSTTRAPARPVGRPARTEAPDSERRRAPASAEGAKAPAKKAPSKRVKKTEKKLGSLAGQNKIIAAPGAAPSKASRETALAAAEAGLERKALNVEILDVAGRVDYADLLVLMTGTSDRHVAAIVQSIEDELRVKHKTRAISVEGLPTANWVLVDFGDVVVHVFQEDARSLYDLDHLWRDATRVPTPSRAAEGSPISTVPLSTRASR